MTLLAPTHPPHPSTYPPTRTIKVFEFAKGGLSLMFLKSNLNSPTTIKNGMTVKWTPFGLLSYFFWEDNYILA